MVDSSCCEDLLLDVVCSMAFEPVIITNGLVVVACNAGASELFDYQSQDGLVGLGVRKLIDVHFEPSVVVDADGGVRVASERDLAFAKVKNENSVKKGAIVNTKSWKSGDKCFYTITIMDIPILRIANSKRMLQPKMGILDDGVGAKHQTALFNYLSQMADALPSLIWIASQGGELLYQNRRVKDECIHPSDASWIVAVWKDGVVNRYPTAFEARYRNKHHGPEPNGEYSYRCHFLQNKPIPNTTQTVCFAIDIHDLKEAEREKQELEARERLAIETSKLKSGFLSTMSHEIRTPLFGIVGNISLIRDTTLTKAQHDFINNIEGSTKLMMAVIQDLLDFSHIEAGKLRISSEPFSLNRTLALCRGMVEQAAKRKGLDFFMTHLDSQVNAMGDCMRLLQVLNNLASNAIKFTDRGIVKIILFHTVNEATLNIKIIVSDTGIGISPDMHSCIFSPWVQADDTNRRRYGGSGLGLAISKAILDLMGGTISAQSEVGVGSHFTVNLKLPSLSPDFDLSTCPSETESPTSEMKLEAYPQPSLSTSSDNKQFKILLAEDSPINQGILHKFFEKMGNIECTLASNGQLACEAYLCHPRHHFHIILLDQTMPEMNGDEVGQKIQNLDPDQIILTISASPKLHHNWNDFILKPIDYNSFQKTISYWLTKSLSKPTDTIRHD